MSKTDSSTTYAPLIDTPESRLQLERLELLANWLDRRFLDPLIGFFVPGAGDTLCSLLGLYGVYVAISLGIHPIVVARMLLNLAIDALVGGVPFVGVFFDIVYRAHVRNLELIKARGSYGKPTLGDWIVVSAAFGVFLIAMLLPLLFIGLLIAFIVHLFHS